MNLHSGGHKQGVVCAPHHAAAEAGRWFSPMAAMRSRPWSQWQRPPLPFIRHMSHVGGDGVWLIRKASGRVRAILG